MAVLGQWLVLLHVASAYAYVTGLGGREVSRAHARRQEKIEPFVQLMRLSLGFERKLIMHALRATIDDPVVRAVHLGEEVIICLMVMKTFLAAKI